MPLPQLPADKANHFLYGTVAAAIAVPIGLYLGLPSSISALAGSIAAGAAKELIDAAQNYMERRRGEQPLHSVDVYDFLATAAGGLTPASVGAQ